MLGYVILGFLFNRNMTGYEIKQMMMQSTSNFIDASFGSIYPALKKFEKDGMISSEEVVGDGRYKKKYSITEKGRIEFMTWLKEPCVFTAFNYEYLTRLFFYKHLENQERIKLINSLITNVNVELDKLKRIEEDCQQYMDFFEHATLRFGKEFYEMIIKWHENLKDEISH